MVLGIGVDILKLVALKADFLKEGDPFLRKVYTKREQEEALLRDDPVYYYGTRFAGKEAVYKALNWNGEHVEFCEIEILNQENGRPYVTLWGKVKKYADKKGIKEVLLSLSYDTDYAIAYALSNGAEIGQTADSVNKKLTNCTFQKQDQ